MQTKYLSIKFYIALLMCLPLSACPQTNSSNPQPTVTAPRYIWTLDWSPDDKYIALAGDDSLVWLYDAASFAVHKTFKMPEMVRCIMWHAQEKLLAVGHRKGVEILDTETGKLISLQNAGGSRPLTWNKDGTMLATAHGQFIQLWTRNGNLVRSIKKENNNTYMGISWHPLGNLIITGSDEIRMFDTSGTQLKKINHRPEQTGVLTVQWHPSGQFFASGDYGHHREGKGSLLQFWNADGSLIRSIPGSKGEYRNIRWNKDGSMLASASDALRIWTKDGEQLAETSSSEEDIIWGVDWNSTGNRIATATFSGTVQIWDSKAKLIKLISTPAK